MRRLLTQVLVACLLLMPVPAFLQVSPEVPEQALSGGSFSNDDTGSTAYLHPTPTLDAKQAELFALGYQMFNNRWAFFWFENAEFGRGPTSNAQSCATCHLNNGRGAAPATPHTQLHRSDHVAWRRGGCLARSLQKFPTRGSRGTYRLSSLTLTRASISGAVPSYMSRS